MPSRFWWITFDVTDLFPRDWQRDVMAVAAKADFRPFPKTAPITREAADVSSVERGRVHADRVHRELPWLCDLYRGAFLDLASQVWTESVTPAKDERYGVVLNVQSGTAMRFECHVDSNPLTGLLFFTDHQEGGGELVVAHDQAASDITSIERDCAVIRPHKGHLVFFDGRTHPHYARPLKGESDMRALAVMNYYTDSWPESTRPRELNHHLYGDAL